MASIDEKISDLSSLNVAAGEDLIPLVDVDQVATKNIRKDRLFGSPGAIGWQNPSTGVFTTIQLFAGTSANEISTDVTLAGGSDNAIPTERAVKIYVDTQVAIPDEHNELSGLQGGDSTNRYHLTLLEHNGLTDGGTTFLHTHSVASFDHNTLGGLQGGDSTTDEYYHLIQQTHDQITSTPTAILLSGGIDVVGHSQIGDTTIDYPGFPTFQGLLRLSETFGSGITGWGKGIILSVDSDASDAAVPLVGIEGSASLSGSTLHGTVTGGSFISGVGASGSTVTSMFGVSANASVSADNSTIDNIIAGDFTASSGFGMSNAVVTKMAAGQFQLLNIGSGDVDITDAYGSLILTPGFTPSGTLTNLYGLYIEDQSGSGFTTDYNLYSAGAASLNKFEGNVDIDGNVTINSSDTTALVVIGDIHANDLFVSGSTIHLGNVQLTEDTAGLKVDKLKLQSGVQVDEFSTDTTLSGDSDTAVPTEKAVKSYVDTQIGLGIETGNLSLSTGDTTADIVFVQQQGSGQYSMSYSIVNTVDNPPLLFVTGVFEKTVDGFKIMFSSPMDTDNYVVSWIVTDALLGSSSSSSTSSSSTSLSTSSSSTSAVTLDNMCDDTNWSESDPGDIGAFDSTGDCMYKFIMVPNVSQGANLNKITSIGGDFLVETEFTLYSWVGTPSSGINADRMVMYLVENTKFGNEFRMGIEGNDVDGFQYYIYTDDSEGVQRFRYGNISTPGSFKVRVRRNADDSITGWNWLNGQWEWDGDTNGFTTNIGEFTIDPFTVNLTSFTEIDAEAFTGSWDTWKLIEGTDGL